MRLFHTFITPLCTKNDRNTHNATLVINSSSPNRKINRQEGVDVGYKKANVHWALNQKYNMLLFFPMTQRRQTTCHDPQFNKKKKICPKAKLRVSNRRRTSGMVVNYGRVGSSSPRCPVTQRTLIPRHTACNVLYGDRRKDIV